MLNPKKGWSIFVFTILLSVVIVVFWSIYSTSRFSTISLTVTRSVLAPIGNVVSKSSHSVRRFFKNIGQYPSLNEEVISLKDENQRLRAEVDVLKQVKEENQRLLSFFRIQQQNSNLLPCSILIRDATNPMNFTINAGTNLKVSENAAVVSPISTGAAKTHFQLVGRISRVGVLESDVLSIYDESSFISIRNLRNNINGTLAYDKQRDFLFIKFYQEHDFKKNDVVVVSSYSSLPNNLILGIVDSVESSSSIHSVAIVRPSFNISTLTEVFVFQ